MGALERRQSNFQGLSVAAKVAAEMEEVAILPDRNPDGTVKRDAGGAVVYVKGPAALARWSWEVACGRDPCRGVGADGEEHRDVGAIPPDWATRRAVYLSMLDRTIGKPKAHVVIEGGAAPVKVEVASSEDALDVLDARELAAALGPDLDAYLRGRKAIQAARKRRLQIMQTEASNVRAGKGSGHREVVGDSPVIDADFEER